MAAEQIFIINTFFVHFDYQDSFHKTFEIKGYSNITDALRFIQSIHNVMWPEYEMIIISVQDENGIIHKG